MMASRKVIGWDIYFMGIAKFVFKRSKKIVCLLYKYNDIRDCIGAGKMLEEYSINARRLLLRSNIVLSIDLSND